MHCRKRYSGLVLGLTLVVAAAACGSSSKGTAATGASGSATTASGGPKPATGTPIQLMTIQSLTGAAAQFQGVAVGAKAAAAAINRAGGIQGRPIEIIACDDKYDPNTAADCARQAVEKKVLAVVGSQTASGEAVMPILEQAGIPSVGGNPNGAKDFSSPMAFPITGGSLTSTLGDAAALASVGAKKINGTYIDVSAAKFIADLFAKNLGGLGLQSAGNTPVPPTATDLSAAAATVVSTRADGAALILSPPLTIKIIQAWIDAGVDFKTKLRVAVPGSNVSDKDIATFGSGSEGLLIVGNTPPPSARDIPAVKDFNAAVDAYGDKSTPRLEDMMRSYEAVQIVARLAQKLATLDSASLVAAIKAAGPTDSGLVGHIDWSKPNTTAGTPLFNTSSFFSVIKSGKVVPLTGKFASVFAPASQ